MASWMLTAAWSIGIPHSQREQLRTRLKEEEEMEMISSICARLSGRHEVCVAYYWCLKKVLVAFRSKSDNHCNARTPFLFLLSKRCGPITFSKSSSSSPRTPILALISWPRIISAFLGTFPTMEIKWELKIWCFSVSYGWYIDAMKSLRSHLTFLPYELKLGN